MKIDTKYFEEMEIDPEKVLDFTDGLPGFPDDKQYVVITDGEATDDTLVFWLQSTQNKHVAFLMLNMLAIKPDYQPDVTDILPEFMGAFDEQSCFIYNIAVIPAIVDKMTVNLRAPIVVNNATKKGCQAIFNGDEYPIRHLVFNELQNMQKAGE